MEMDCASTLWKASFTGTLRTAYPGGDPVTPVVPARRVGPALKSSGSLSMGEKLPKNHPTNGISTGLLTTATVDAERYSGLEIDFDSGPASAGNQYQKDTRLLFWTTFHPFTESEA